MRMMLSALALAAAGPVLAEPPRIAVDTPITASLVRQVAGDLAQVQVLLPQGDRKSTRLNSSHVKRSRMPSSA